MADKKEKEKIHLNPQLPNLGGSAQPSQATTTPAKAGASNPGQPADAADDTAKSQAQLDAMRAKMNEFMGQHPQMASLMRMFGLGGETKHVDAETEATNTVFDNMAHLALHPGNHGKAEVPGLKDYSGDATSVEANMQLQIDKMFKEGKLKFSDDPAKNLAGVTELKAEVHDAVAAGKVSGGFEARPIMDHMTQAMKDLHGSMVIEPKAEYPKPAVKVENPDLMYGKKLEVHAGDKASVEAAGFKGHHFAVNSMDANGNLTQLGEMNPRQLANVLGPDYTIQAVNIKHNDPVDTRAGAKATPVDGYYISNAKGEGFYVSTDTVDPAKSKVDIDMAMKPEPAAPAPKPDEPAPGAQVAPVVAQPVVAMGMSPS